MPDIFQPSRNIAHQLASVQQKVQLASTNANRSHDSVKLLAVSKTQAASTIRAAFNAGQTAFGENYLQEARSKQSELDDLAIEWHFIGPVQSNKTREIAEHFNWVHSVDRLKIAQRLSQQRPAHLAPLNICLQINIDNETAKAGADISQLDALAEQMNTLPQLCLRGLMAIPAPRHNTNEQHAVFDRVSRLQQQLMANNPSLELDTLSIGMSSDMEAAILAGSTIVRIGTAIFGSRRT